MKPLVKNAADEGQVREAKQKEKFGRDRQLEDLRAVLRTREGRRFIWGLLAPLEKISAVQSGSWTYFNEGERNFALTIKADVIAASPEAYLLMQSEHIQELKNRGEG